ncbi:MAG: D-lyxose/D-mannose family sugar isomerase [Lachnospiraceae bacterium]|nr:D-lyxose/D-mannose family sugar isomerase [Lachnospiraceae bacterium]
MKRSEIQTAIAWAKELLDRSGFRLPSFAYWSMEEWQSKKPQLTTVFRTMRGWDVTSFGHDNFEEMGAVLFTIRNGVPGTDIGCPYAEKLILMKEGQTLPMHFHFTKTEDIINRGGGVLMIQVYNSLPDGSADEANDVRILSDGVESYVPAGSFVEITRGNSMTIYPGLYHLFKAKPGTGNIIVGEVSSINDDNADNRFLEQRPRFIAVEEDEEITVPLCNEYEKVLQ